MSSSVAFQEDGHSQWDSSLKSDAGLLSMGLPATPMGRQQKMMKQRQLALTRQRNLVKNSIRTVQQNDLPAFAARLPSCGHIFTDTDEHTSCAEAAAADVSLATAAAGGSMVSGALASDAGSDQWNEGAGNRPETASLSLSADSQTSPVFPRLPPAGASFANASEPHSVEPTDGLPLKASSPGVCWGGPVKEEEVVEPEQIKERSLQGRKFWRPWKASRPHAVSISEAEVTVVEAKSVVTSFSEDPLDCSLDSCSTGVNRFASTSSRAATPWQAAPEEEEEDFDVTTIGISGGTQDICNTKCIQLPIQPRRHCSAGSVVPIQPRRHCSEPEEIWLGAAQQQLFSARAEGDIAPRSLNESAGDSCRQRSRHRGSRLRRLKLWREPKAQVAPDVEPLTEDHIDPNIVTSFEID